MSLEPTLTASEISTLAEQLVDGRWWQGDMAFISRQSRDSVAKAAIALGAKVKKSSIRNQLLDPRYTIEGRHLPDLGMGNDKQMFGVLYVLDVVPA
jgi:hypothetical protein